MSDLDFRLVDAFAFAPFTGNPAGVILDAEGLTDSQMQLLARDINASETAFVLPPPDARSALRLRWFTPNREVEFCGHATLGAVHALNEAGGLPKGAPGGAISIAFTRGIFDLRVEFAERGDVQTLYWFDAPDSRLLPPALPPEPILQALGASLGDLDPRLPPVMTSERDIILGFAELATLLALQPDDSRLKDLCEKNRLRGVCVTTPSSLSASLACHSRFFAPAFGISEDPVTGSLHGPLAAHYTERGLISLIDGRAGFQCAQGGGAGGRSGVVRVIVSEQRDAPADSGRLRVRVGGACHTVIRGTMARPPAR